MKRADDGGDGMGAFCSTRMRWEGKGRRKHRIENVGGVCGCEGLGLMLDLVGGGERGFVGRRWVSRSVRQASKRATLRYVCGYVV